MNVRFFARCSIFALILVLAHVAAGSTSDSPATAHEGTPQAPQPPSATWICDQSPLTIVNARLLASPSKKVSVTIRDGRIASIVPGSTDTTGRVLDAKRAWLLPGFIDAHSHLDTLPAAKQAARTLEFQRHVLPITLRSSLASGVTAARLHLARFEDLALLRELSNDPCVPGPRLQLAGPGLLGGNPTVESPLMVGVRNANQIAAHIFRTADLGAQWIALHGLSRFDAPALHAVQEAAAGAGIRLMAEADNMADFEAALGTSVETLEYLDRSTTPSLADDLVRRASGRVAVVPPIGFYQIAEALWARRRDIGDVDPFVDEVVPSLWSQMIRSLPSEIREDDYVRHTAASVPTHRAKFQQLHQEGVTLLLGTDSGSPGQMHHRALWNEIAAWHDYGATSAQIIRAGTTSAAHWLNWPEVGAIRSGNHADLLLYQGDLANQSLDRRKLTHVLKAGVVYLDAGRWVGPNVEGTRHILVESSQRARQASRRTTRRYCTEIGSFNFEFFGDLVVGNYVLLPQDRMGTFFGRLEETTARGRWLDPDGQGALIAEFSPDFLSFSAKYRNDKAPETWHRNWNGTRRRGREASFVLSDVRYHCER